VNPEHPLKGDGSNRIEFRHVWFTYQKLTPEQQAAVSSIQAAQNAFPEGLKPGESIAQLAARLIPCPFTSTDLAALENIDWILKDVSFTVEPGHTVAIVGHTGAGKTTLTSLMMRFYDVTAGQILLDGVDLREQDLTALRQHFAVVLQDPFLFTGTIKENIRMGNEAITDADLLKAANDVNVLDFIESLPEKFDEPVQERDSGRSDVERGHRHRAAHSRRAGAHGRRPHQCADCPSPLHRATRRHHSGDAQRAVARDGHAPGTAGPSRALLEALPAPVQGPGSERHHGPHPPALHRAR